MVPVCTNTPRSLEQIDQTFARLSKQVSELGLSLSVWSSQCQIIGELTPGSEFCRLIHQAGGPCTEVHRSLAQRVISDGWGGTSACEHGCCLLGVPVYHRRRLIGALVGSFPAGDMLKEQALTDLCEKLDLNSDVLKQHAIESSHSGVEAQDFLAVLRWLLEANQMVDVADNEIATLTANLARTYEELSLVYRISGSMQVTQQPDTFLENICNELVDVMEVESTAAVIHPHATTMTEDLIVVSGKLDLDPAGIKLLASDYIAPRFQSNPGPILENQFVHVQGHGCNSNIRNYVAVSLGPDNPIGLLMAFNKEVGDFDSFDLKLINSIGNQAAVFLANSRLYADLQDLLMGVLHALSATIDAKDPYTSGHSFRVAMISKRLAQECGYRPEKLQRFYVAGLLHDIGKIGVPEATLRKEGKLTDEEYEQIKRHPAIGAAILGGIRQLEDIIIYILTHHERPDGKGYPRALSGDAIPKEGLIVGLADSFDAMTTERVYRKGLTLEEACDELRRYSGKQFDPQLVEKFLALDLQKLLSEIHEPETAALPAGLSWDPLPEALRCS